MKVGRRVLEQLASLGLAVVTMTALAVVCAVATLHESRHGAASAQEAFYGTWWFAALLALLAANVLLSMVRRWPWKADHAGFVLAALTQMIAVAKPLFGGWVIFPMLLPLGLANLALVVWLLWKGFRREQTA